MVAPVCRVGEREEKNMRAKWKKNLINQCNEEDIVAKKVQKKERGKRNEKARGEKRKEGGVKCVDRILFIVLSVDSPQSVDRFRFLRSRARSTRRVCHCKV